jgi:MFS family permease
MRDRGPRRVGWAVVALGAFALGILAVYLVNDSSDIGPTDEAWGYVGWFISPFLAGGAALAIGVLSILVATLKLVDVRVARAAKATGVGCLLAPVVFVLSFLGLVALLAGLEVTASWLWPWFTLALPIAIGVTTVMVELAPTRARPSKDPEVAAVVKDPEEVLGSAVRERFDYLDDFGLSARVTMGLPANAFDVTLEIAQGPDRSLELLSRVIGRLGRVLAQDRTDEGARLQGVVRAGFLNMMPAVVTVTITEVNPGRSKVVIAGVSKDGLIKQRPGEGAVRRILKAANLPPPAR